VIEEKIRRARLYIGENYTSDISREGLAASLSMHPDSLGRFFRMYTGKRIGEYINELRVRKVAEELDKSEDSIVQIAFAAGFESIATSTGPSSR
jgi:transcriptional regulator GlxA family with amidase domain